MSNFNGTIKAVFKNKNIPILGILKILENLRR